MAQVESTAGMVDVDRAAQGEWLSWTRMSDYAESAPPVIVGGDGPYVIDQDGRRLLDCVSGLFTTQIGYSHGARIGAAAATQLERLGFYPNWAATHPAALALTERILGLAPAGLTRLFLTSGGSESVESAWKLARQHHLAKGQHARRKVIARRGAYHGCSLGALSLTGIPAARAAVRAAARRRAPRREHRRAQLPDLPRDGQRLHPRRRGRRAADPRRGPRQRRDGDRRARPERGRLPRAAARLREGAARDLRPLRRAALLRRGDHGLRPARRVVRLDPARLRAGHHHEREGHDLGLRAARRRAVLGQGRRAVPDGEGRVHARLHVRRTPALVRDRPREPGDHGRAAACCRTCATPRATSSRR